MLYIITFPHLDFFFLFQKKPTTPPASHEHVVDPHHGQSQQLISVTRVIVCNVFGYKMLSGQPLLITVEDLSKVVDV